jgi:hypothetical protein
MNEFVEALQYTPAFMEITGKRNLKKFDIPSPMRRGEERSIGIRSGDCHSSGRRRAGFHLRLHGRFRQNCVFGPVSTNGRILLEERNRMILRLALP